LCPEQSTYKGLRLMIAKTFTEIGRIAFEGMRRLRGKNFI
jgi:hypothetical protein